MIISQYTCTYTYLHLIPDSTNSIGYIYKHLEERIQKCIFILIQKMFWFILSVQSTVCRIWREHAFFFLIKPSPYQTPASTRYQMHLETEVLTNLCFSWNFRSKLKPFWQSNNIFFLYCSKTQQAPDDKNISFDNKIIPYIIIMITIVI